MRASSEREAPLAVEGIRAGGIPIVEVTRTVPGAVEVIRQLARSGGNDLRIGAGTVLDAESAARCLDAGAVFLVSPGFDLATVKFAREKGILMIPGALTPTEIIAAWNAGSDLVKVFPCGTVGGAKYKALKARCRWCR